MSWLIPYSEGEHTLYCVPHAGAGASVYRRWADRLDAAVVGVQPPGREQRRRDPAMPDVAAAGRAVAEAIAARPGPFTLFGHSLGALIAFEAARVLVGVGRSPERLIVSGARAPQLPRTPGALLTDAQLLDRLKELGGTPAQLFDYPELLDLFVPVVRADFALVGGYRYAAGAPLALPVAALGGVSDPEVPRADLLAWRAQAGGAFEAALFPGGHFFLHEEGAALGAIARMLP